MTVNATTNSVTVRAIFPNPRGELLPGLFVRARMEEGSTPDAILVPQLAVSRNSKGEPTRWSWARTAWPNCACSRLRARSAINGWSPRIEAGRSGHRGQPSDGAAGHAGQSRCPPHLAAAATVSSAR